MFFDKKYYWLTAMIDGKLTLLYPPYETEKEARDKGFEKLRGVLFDVFVANTRDQGKATQQYRMKYVDDSDDKAQALSDAIKPMKHKL